jgi:hypothetical protein
MGDSAYVISTKFSDILSNALVEMTSRIVDKMVDSMDEVNKKAAYDVKEQNEKMAFEKEKLKEAEIALKYERQAFEQERKIKRLQDENEELVAKCARLSNANAVPRTTTNSTLFD